MSDISLSKAVRSNLLSLQNTADMMATTQNRLATGNKVNSALDNPTNFFTASSLNSRASDINQLMDSMANGIQTIEAADNGLTAITKTLESMQSTLRQARQDKSFETGSFTLGESASGKISLSGGSLEGAHDINLNKAQAESVTSGAVYKVQGSTGADPLTAATDFASDGLDVTTAGDGPLTFTVGNNNDGAGVTVTIDEDTAGIENAEAVTLDEVVAATNAQLDVGGSTVRARANEGKLEFYETDTTNVGAGAQIAVTDDTGADRIGFTGAAGTLTEAGADATDYDFTISDGDNTANITINGDKHDTAEKAVAEINKQLRAEGINDLSASVKDGRLSISGPADGSAATITIADGSAANDSDVHLFGTSAQRTETTASADGGAQKTVDELVSEINSNTSGLASSIRASNDNGKLRIENLSTTDLNIGGVSSNGEIDGESSGAQSIGGNSVRAGLADQYNELRDQLDKLADDASFNGINLLRGDNLKITFNETGTSELDIRSEGGEAINSSTLGIKTNMEASDLDSDANIDEMLASVKTAINEVRSQSSAFGSSLSIVENRQDFSKNMINTLETGAGNLTLADSNQEAANLLALQTRQQLSSTALSMASQQDQAVLRLF